MKKRAFIILILAVVIVGTGIFFLSDKTKNQPKIPETLPNAETLPSTQNLKTYKVVLGENGFEPQNITIKKGDVIEFSTSGDKHFWPASDIHPTHGIYPEFDPQDAIQPGKTWSYKFEKTGTWRFHDHLAPYHTGRITVE